MSCNLSTLSCKRWKSLVVVTVCYLIERKEEKNYSLTSPYTYIHDSVLNSIIADAENVSKKFCERHFLCILLISKRTFRRASFFDEFPWNNCQRKHLLKSRKYPVWEYPILETWVMRFRWNCFGTEKDFSRLFFGLMKNTNQSIWRKWKFGHF